MKKKSDIFTAESILIFSLVIDISIYFQCRFWIASEISIHLTSLKVPDFRNSNAYNYVIHERQNIKCGHSCSQLECKEQFGTKFFCFAKKNY